jgi:Tol biopolymer transport system component/DNA-binding winged helix-turn-helix (wHTH) protein
MADGGRSTQRRLRVGGHEVDVERRIITSLETGESARVTVKSMQVLLVLCEAQGQVVGRETLMQRVWKGRCPTDDVLTQAIAQLRRTFRDTRDAPCYLETIAKGGYRLIAPCRWIEAVLAAPLAEAPEGEMPMGGAPGPALEPAPSVPQDSQRAGHWDEVQLEAPPVVAAVAAAPENHSLRLPIPPLGRAWPLVLLPLLLLGWVAWWLLGVRPAAADVGAVTGVVPLQYQAIVSTPTPERAPALSPDGSRVAYTRQVDGQFALFVQDSGATSARRLTTPPAGQDDQMPVWSPDGHKLAFIRRGAQGCSVLVVAASGGGKRHVGSCEHGADAFDWSPDGLSLLMGGVPAADGGAALRRLDLRSGQWSALDYPRASGDVDTLPRFSPDGQWLAFRRGTSLGDLWLMPAGGGSLERLTRVRGDIRGWDWLPDSAHLVLSLIKDEARLYRLSLQDRRLMAFAELGRGNAVNPDVAARAWAMVYELDQFHGGLYRRDLSLGDSGHAEPLFPSSGVDVLPAVSPDGTTLAFVSDRSLAAGLWIGEPEQPETLRRLGQFTPVPRHAPVWSADGRQLLVIATSPAGDHLLEVDVASGQAQVLAVPDHVPAFAAYTGDPDQLLVGVDAGQGRLRLVLFRRQDWKVLARLDDVTLARYDAVGERVCFTRASGPGLWCADAALANLVQVSRELPGLDRYRDWNIAGGQIQLLDPRPGCQVHVLHVGQAQSGHCLHAGQTLVEGSLALEPAGRWLYLSLVMDANVDIGAASLRHLSGEVPK